MKSHDGALESESYRIVHPCNIDTVFRGVLGVQADEFDLVASEEELKILRSK
jgi:hypothetical protein